MENRKIELLNFLGQIKDKRVQRTKKYPLSEILFLVLWTRLSFIWPKKFNNSIFLFSIF